MVEGRTHKPVIQTEQCQSCHVCVRGCPAERIPEYRQEGDTLRGRLYGSKLRAGAPREKSALPPCQESCPIHQDTRGYVGLIAKGKFREALELIREVNPLPAVCGFICHHLCEGVCLRTEVDQPVPIRLLKRFVAEYEGGKKEARRRTARSRREKIMVVGSGPAGLAAANDLRLLGYEVTVFEALPVLGGMLAVGIPEFRLPRKVLQTDIDGIRDLGVEMETRHRIFFDKKQESFRRLGFQAAFLSTGAHRSVSLHVPGERLEGVLSGVEFLREINLGRTIKIGKKVAVIGGGNVALDVARSAIRMGAETVGIYYRRTRNEMPAIPEEVEETTREGVEIRFLASPVRLVGHGKKVTGIELIRMELAKADETGRPAPVPIHGSEYRVRAETVISAVGQKVDPRGLKGFDRNKDGTIRIDPKTGATSMEGVFAGGDMVSGPGWAIDAIAAGKKAAESIDRYLS
jgi:NADPH-dependent glutamate synthase beta subunit-like oxidoreductase